MSNTRTRTLVTALVALALVVPATAANAQTHSRAFYQTMDGVTLAGSVTCGAIPGGTYTVDTEVAVTLVAEGALEPSGTIQLPAGSVATFTVSGPNTLALDGADVETLFDNTGCSGELTITAADDGSSSVHVRNVLRTQLELRAATSRSRRIRG